MTPILVHLSDLHLGFRAFPRVEQGRNLRERDLSQAFRWALQETIRIRPDLLLITGDIFDHPDPPHTALLAIYRGIGLLRSRLPGTRVLLIAGERDTPTNPAELGPVATLDLHPGVEAAAVTPRSLRFKEMGIHALLVPHRAAIQPPWPEIRPDPSATWNLLLLRGEFDGRGGGIPVDPQEWSYVAVGGPHRPITWAPNVRAAGALERPERDPWGSAGKERGFISYDLAQGSGEFHPVPGRPVVDLAPIRVVMGDPLTGARRLREVVEGLPGGIDGKIVRVRLSGEIQTPEEGVSEGLVAAIAERASHVEYRISSDTPRLGRESEGKISGRGGWIPEALVARSGTLHEGDESLPSAGVVLLTADTEELRARLARELREGTPPVGSPALLQLRPPLPDSLRNSVAALLTLGDPDPVWLLREGSSALSGNPEERSALLSSPPEPIPVAISSITEPSPQELLQQLEAEQNVLRADWVEASGDLEAKMLEWVRERQDADSHLQGYRDRALELRGKIRGLEMEGESSLCPTCGKPIGKEFPRLMETLRDEWEAVVQDGKWWKRRREQLELKPLELRKMEETVLRLQARVAESGEKLERERVLHPLEGLSGGEGEDARQETKELPPLEGLPGVRSLLQEAGNLLHRWTEGRIMGIRAKGAELRLLGMSGEERAAEGAEVSALGLAIRLSLRNRISPTAGIEVLLLWELHESGSAEMAVSLIESLSREPSGESLVLAVVPPSVLGRTPEQTRFALEFRSDERGRIRSRKVWGGMPELTLEGGRQITPGREGG